MPSTTTRRLVGAAGAVLALGVLTSALPGLSLAQAGSAPSCTNADLHAAYRGGEGAAGTIYGRIVLTNTSQRTCTTGGYGGLSYVGDGNGTQIGAPAVRTDPADAKVYLLRPGQRLRSPIGEGTALNYPKKLCHPAHVDGLRVYVPNSYVSQFIAHPTTGCRKHGVTLITQKPYRRP